MSEVKPNVKNCSRYTVAVGGAKCGQTVTLDSLIDGNAKKYAMRIGKTDGLRQNHVETFLKKKKCTTLTVEALLDVDARDTFTNLIVNVIEKQQHVGKHVHQETRSFFEVPQALRKHVSTVIVFKSANEDERRRIYRYFANQFFTKREDFDEVVNSLNGYDCLLMDLNAERGNKAEIYNAKDGGVKRELAIGNIVKVEKEGEKPVSQDESDKKPIGYKKWFWSLLGY